MKKIILISCLTTTSFLFAGCNATKINQNNQIKIEEKTKMTRIKTNSGLEYEITKEGSGISPTKGQNVTVHYSGYLNNNGNLGSKFDSSIDRGQPFTFKIGVAQVIKGWDEGVMSMKIGEKRRLFIPSKLGYGVSGAGNVIPPNANLIFDVELLQIS